MDFNSRLMKGSVYVGSKWLSRNAVLEKWPDVGMGYTSSLLKK
jgi:hypothetical protein